MCVVCEKEKHFYCSNSEKYKTKSINKIITLPQKESDQNLNLKIGSNRIYSSKARLSHFNLTLKVKYEMKSTSFE